MKELLQKLIRCAPTAENGEWQISQVLKSYFADAGIDSELDCCVITGDSYKRQCHSPQLPIK